ncbi:TPA: hypothetical protein N0F65_006640 [Lagenidium giganteum]|uniref:PH domain-containing protein n=1 Tax=Lagenidium giganteum TaxID=4803 RepID=A0AAV2ZAA3_9STRA|nr:TPA: hypothetical protein N0F65_006640 [Lagenidium giganteum]
MLTPQPSTYDMSTLNGIAAGFLRRRGDLTGTWKSRYFVFQNGRLSSRKSDKRDARVKWEETVIDARPSQGVRNGLMVTLASGRVLMLSAGSEELAMQWSEVFAEYLVRLKHLAARKMMKSRQVPIIKPSMEVDLSLKSSVFVR